MVDTEYTLNLKPVATYIKRWEYGKHNFTIYDFHTNKCLNDFSEHCTCTICVRGLSKFLSEYNVSTCKKIWSF